MRRWEEARETLRCSGGTLLATTGYVGSRFLAGYLLSGESAHADLILAGGVR